MNMFYEKNLKGIISEWVIGYGRRDYFIWGGQRKPLR